MDRRARLAKLPFTLFPVALILMFAASCALGGGRRAVGDGIQVRVVNDLVPSTTFSISVVTATGGPAMLGSVIAGGTETFTYAPTLLSGTFRLLADRPGPGGQILSEPIIFPEDGSGLIRWELATNNIVVQ